MIRPGPSFPQNRCIRPSFFAFGFIFISSFAEFKKFGWPVFGKYQKPLPIFWTGAFSSTSDSLFPGIMIASDCWQWKPKDLMISNLGLILTNRSWSRTFFLPCVWPIELSFRWLPLHSLFWGLSFMFPFLFIFSDFLPYIPLIFFCAFLLVSGVCSGLKWWSGLPHPDCRGNESDFVRKKIGFLLFEKEPLIT